MSDDDGLAARLGTNRGTLGRLYDRYYTKVLAYCIHRLFSRQAAEDVASDVFLRIAKDIRRFKGSDEQDLRNWIYTIAINQVNTHIRKTGRRKNLFEDACDKGAIGSCAALEPADKSDWAKLYDALASLKPAQQDAITLRYFEGLSPKQIAGVLQVNPGTVRTMLFRAVRKLRKHLSEYFGNQDRAP